MRTLRLHDTRSGELRAVEPAEDGRVRIYACGPTVYGRVHVGNARPFVVFSLMRRFLAHEGYAVTLVCNITDVNDKIYAAASAAGIDSAALAEQMTAHYVADTDRLGLGRPDAEPRASQSIEGIIALIERLIAAGHAYASQGDVYFAVRTDPDYGELSHRRIDEGLDQEEGAEGLQRKRDPLDFALWKAHKPGEDTSWPSPWGPGRPGWHIECSAMAEELLGTDFEIHGGGLDLVFPHHENEIAQTRGATGEPLARLWAHSGMIRMDSEKMSKSIGNTFGLGAAIEAHGPLTLIVYLVQGLWRAPIDYDEERLAEAAAFAERIREAGARLPEGPSPDWSTPLRERFLDALAADFNTPRALAVIADWVRTANRAVEPPGRADLAEMLSLLGLGDLLAPAEGMAIPPEAVRLLDAREAARAERDWERADRLREEIGALGYAVRDGAEGPTLRPL